MKEEPFSLAIDGSNDNGLQKMNPMTVRIFDVSHGRISTKFLDMCALHLELAQKLQPRFLSPWTLLYKLGIFLGPTVWAYQ